MRFSGGREVRLRAKSGLFINPKDWNKEKGGIKSLSRLKTPEQKELTALQVRLTDLCNVITTTFTETDKDAINKEWLDTLIDKFHFPEKYNGAPKYLQTDFFEVFDVFTSTMGKLNQWTKGTYQKFAALKKHIQNFNPAIRFNDLTKDTLTDFVYFMQEKENLINSTIGKQLGFLKWFLRWATAEKYNTETAFISFRPKLKQPTENKVIFLDWDELMTLYAFDFSRDKRLDQVRDVFCFCCFTSLRYSDVANLRRSNIYDDRIEIVTVKTNDKLEIELNKYSQSILDKYRNIEFGDNLALPVITNQRMNEYIKEVAQICDFNEMITRTYYKGNKRYDETKPKYELIGTHTARRTFICNALMLGIQPQIVMKWTGHNDYKSMKPYIDIADKKKAEAMKLFDK